MRHILSLLLLLLLPLLSSVSCDRTSCSPEHSSGHEIYFVCSCYNSNDHHHNNNDNDDKFSLADFAYSLNGAYFAKDIFVTFKRCRFIRLLLDQAELATIGSEYFRPDIQVMKCHQYHLHTQPPMWTRPPQ